MPAAPFPWVFPYQDDPAVAGEPRLGRAVLRPLVECRLSAREMNERTWALVDSGSEYTLAMRWVAQVIGVEPDENREIILGIGGESIRVRFADVNLHLGPRDRPEDEWMEWRAEIGFVEHWRASWPVVLGQRGFFDQFTVTMNRGTQAFAVTAYEDFDERFTTPLAPAQTDPPRHFSA
jgi:hypothetical protein